MTKAEKTVQAPAQPPPMHNPYKDLGLGNRVGTATAGQVNWAYGWKMLRINVDPDDVYSRGHTDLQILSDATMILRDEQLCKVLICCIKKSRGDPDIRDCDILDVNQDAPNEEVKRVYELQMARWIGFERYITLIVTVMSAARDRMYSANKSHLPKDSLSPRSKPSTPAPTAS